MYTSIIEPVGSHGGMDYYDYGLAYGLGENNIGVTFYTCEETQVRSFKNVVTKPAFGDIWHSPFLKKTYLYLKGHITAYKDAKARGSKIVHLHFFFFRGIDLLVLVLAKLFSLKIVVTVHDVKSFHNRSKRLIEKYSYKLIDGVIVHNKLSESVLLSNKYKIKSHVVIPHGNYLPFIDKMRAKETGDSFTLLFFGHVKDVKGLDILLKALQKVANLNKTAKLIVAGKPYKTDSQKYKNMITELGLAHCVHTEFRYIPDHEVKSFFEKADLVVLPYREIYQSGVLLLAMSYGRPLLCSDLAAFKEIITDKATGYIFKNGDSDDLADKLIEIMKDKNALNDVTKKAWELVSTEFDWVNIGRRTRSFYEEICKTQSSE